MLALTEPQKERNYSLICSIQLGFSLEMMLLPCSLEGGDSALLP